MRSLFLLSLITFTIALALRSGHVATTDRFIAIQVDQLATFNGRIDESPCLVDFGSPLPGVPINNWNPPCLGTNTIVQVTASDNTGTLITGIQAAASIGSVLTVCNESSTTDDGVIAFSSLDSASSVGNRILTPGTGLQRTCSVTTTTSCQVDADCPVTETCSPSTGARYYVGPDQCVTLRYIDAGAPISQSWPEWIVEAPIRTDQGIVQNLTFYPALTASPITSGSIVDDYNPTCTGGLPCSEAGGDNAFLSYSMITLQTTAVGGVTIKGFHYVSDIHSPTQGPVKVIVNSGPGPITLANGASTFPLENIDDGANGDNRGDIAMRPGSTVWLYHPRDTGSWIVLGKRDYWFSERDVNMTMGASVSGPDANAGIANTTLFVDKTADAGLYHTYMRDVHAYAVAGIHYGLTVSQNATGLAAGQNRALLLDAPDYSIEIDHGGIYAGLGAVLPFGYFNIGGVDGADFSSAGPVKVEGPLRVNGGAFTGETLTKIASPAVPTVNKGSLDASSTNFIGRVTAVGATTTTLTFGAGGFSTTAFCGTQVEGAGLVNALIDVSPSATAPVFSCQTLAGATTNCPNFVYQCWGH